MSRNPLLDTVREILSRASYGTDGRREPTFAEARFEAVLSEAFPKRVQWLIELDDGGILAFVGIRDGGVDIGRPDAGQFERMLHLAGADVAATIFDGTRLPSPEEVRSGFDRHVTLRPARRASGGRI